MIELNEKESKFSVPSECGQLEAIFNKGNADGFLSHKNAVVIICHPHPLHGGSMDNKVVTTLMRTYRDLGIHVLRFNFRGVGASDGVFDQAKGELTDLLSVMAWCSVQYSSCPLLLAGFSFGSSIAARASYSANQLVHLTLVAPPVERYEYDRDAQFRAPVCIVQGDMDERVLAQGVYDWVRQLKGDVELIRYAEAGHFFHGFLSHLKTDLSAVLLKQISV